jgi:hypothetical protein
MTAGETGLLTLVDCGRLPETPHFPVANKWQDLLASIQALIEQEHDFRTVVIDTINGAERLCHEYVCQRDFNGEWGEKGFNAYKRGQEVALNDWKQLIDLFDQLKAKGVRPLLLAHTATTTFKNPMGADYDRYQADLNQKTWAMTAKWLDAIFFGDFETILANEKDPMRKTKAINSEVVRVLYTEERASFDAKNRFGLPASIEMPNDPKGAYDTLMAAIRDARKAAA